MALIEHDDPTEYTTLDGDEDDTFAETPLDDDTEYDSGLDDDEGESEEANE